MATVSRWSGAEAKALRLAMRLSQRDFASRFEVGERTVARWDTRGASILPSPEMQSLLDIVLEQQPQEVRQRFWDIVRPNGLGADALTTQHMRGIDGEGTVDPMKRRTLMKWGAASVALLSLRSDTNDSIGQVSARDVRLVEKGTAELHKADHLYGGNVLWEAAEVHVNFVHRMLNEGTFGDEIGDQLLKAAGRLQICVGWLAFDAGKQETARQAYNEALSLALQSRDPEVETRAFANLAFQSNLLNNPQEARRFAIAAEDSARRLKGASRVSAIPQLRLAISAAKRSEGREADVAISFARKALDEERDDQVPEWCAFLSATEIDGVEATCSVRLGKPARAAGLLEKVVDMHGDGYVRNRALYRVRLARARIEARELEGAALAANTALDDLADGVGSRRVNGELKQVVRLLAPHSQVEGVGQLLHRMDPQ